MASFPFPCPLAPHARAPSPPPCTAMVAVSGGFVPGRPPPTLTFLSPILLDMLSRVSASFPLSSPTPLGYRMANRGEESWPNGWDDQRIVYWGAGNGSGSRAKSGRGSFWRGSDGGGRRRWRRRRVRVSPELRVTAAGRVVAAP